jgi:hypothetical protein
MVIQRAVAAGIAVAVALAAVPFAQGAEKRKKVKPAPAPAVTSAPAPTERAAPAAPGVPAAAPGWTAVNTNSPNLAHVSYKIDGRDIIVRFRNISDKSPIRVRYTVKWKRGQNNVWTDDATMEGISFRLKPLEELDREVRTRAPEVKDVVVDVDIAETS